MKNLAKPLTALALIIIISAAIARIYSSGETLAEYARNNPDIAFATPSATPKLTISPIPAGIQPAATPMPDGVQPAATLMPDGVQSAVTPAAIVTPDTGISFAPTTDAEADTQKPASDLSALSEASPTDREIYRPDFYKESLSESLIAHITGISYPIPAEEAEALTSGGKALPDEADIISAVNIIEDEQAIAISYDQLRHLNILYHDFNGEVQTGELICNNSIADDLLEIFYELYQNKYPIEKVRLIEEYNGDDTLSMLDNNTSCFNYRLVDGSSNLSKHALGLAIDINPFYNPYVVFQKDGSTYISPEGSEIYTDRSKDFPYKIDENDLCYKLFTEHGFIWGGNWNTMKDYQHFQKS